MFIPKVSVLMPVYKTSKVYLHTMIESILMQTLTDFKFQILDDCPTDTREKIEKSYDDKRIKFNKIILMVLGYNSSNIGSFFKL